METKPQLESWDDQTVLLTLSHVTHRLLGNVPVDQRHVVVTEEDARQVLAAFVQQYGGANEGIRWDQIVPNNSIVHSVSRQVLEQVLDDPAVRPDVEDLIEEPPQDAQMTGGLELVAESAIVLGALIAWLQTKVDLSVERKGGQVNWSFKLRKTEADPGVIADIANKLLTYLRN